MAVASSLLQHGRACTSVIAGVAERDATDESVSSRHILQTIRSKRFSQGPNSSETQGRGTGASLLAQRTYATLSCWTSPAFEHLASWDSCRIRARNDSQLLGRMYDHTLMEHVSRLALGLRLEKLRRGGCCTIRTNPQSSRRDRENGRDASTHTHGP